MLIPGGDVATGSHAVLALASAQEIAGHVLDGGEVRRRVLASYAALIVAEHHVHHPVQPILDAQLHKPG